MMYFTPDKRNLLLKKVSGTEDERIPSAIAIQVIKQFARSYYVAQELKLSCRNFMLN